MTPEDRAALLDPLRLLVDLARARYFFAPPAMMKNPEGELVHNPDGGSGLKGGNPLGYHLPNEWQQTPERPSSDLDLWDGESAICLLGGFGVDILDHDPRNGSDTTAETLSGHYPEVYAEVSSPSRGQHFYVAPLGLHKASHGGIDILGKSQFAFAPGTVRRSKAEGDAGALRPYAWTQPPTEEGLARIGADKTSGDYFRTFFKTEPKAKPAPKATASDLPTFKSFPKRDRREIKRLVNEVIIPGEVARLTAMQDKKITDYGANKAAYTGEAWRNGVRESARTFVRAARAPWNQLTLDQARTAYMEAAPTDPKWTTADNEAHWVETVEWAEANNAVRDVPDLPSRFDPGKGKPTLDEEGTALDALAPDFVTDPEHELTLRVSKKAWPDDAEGNEHPQFAIVRNQVAQQIGRDVARFIKEGATPSIKSTIVLRSQFRARLPEREAVVEGFVYRGETTILYGPSDFGKSLVALDAAMSVATERPLGPMGCDIQHGAILYLYTEGSSTILERVEAWEHKFNDGQMAADDRLYIYHEPVVLTNRKQVAELVEFVHDNNIILVIFDTLSRLSNGVNENNSWEMEPVMAAGRKILAGNNAGGLVVHHPAKTGDDPRGTVAIRNNSDSVFVVSEEGAPQYAIKSTKNKAGKHGTLGRYRIEEEFGSVVIVTVPYGTEAPQATTALSSADRAFNILYQEFGPGGADKGSWVKQLLVSDFAPATAYAAIKSLAEKGRVTLDPVTNRYTLPKGTTNVNPI